ncbi:osmotically inducible protein OsmC [Pseudooceanicola nitratireducens]|uniref:Osmotically inducible protein OsmC n=1 Tax=Pseudooceanicola nitratireducens TaxID=517719 RepID=A0A1I1LSZ3_9RHOB|nr:OsmC family protein [Pseudooceanicola nitratireducens]SEJ65396.1 osmotically inducible protein OsmC [Pseudooceanicola nitratireducens]SFC75622.1 osmotically inducible protein OsmC [Pseudooceanicola nitratireducens]
MIKKHGSAIWTGTIREGSGKVNTQSGVLSNVRYGFNKRFGDEPGTNPEELAGAAHASCFAMALSLQLENAGMEAEELDATSTVYLDKEADGFAIKKVHLDLKARIPGADEEKFQEAAAAAKAGCPISKLFAGAEITLDAKLV